VPPSLWEHCCGPERFYLKMVEMEAEGLIRFTNQQTQLPYYLSMPSSEQDKQRALTDMRRDGFIQ